MMPAGARAAPILRLVLAIALFLLSLLAVCRAPHIAAWIPAVVATEGGIVLPLIALALLPWGRAGSAGKAGTILLLCAFLLALSPLLRAIPVAGALPERFAAVFGASPAPPVLAPGALLRWSAPDIPPRTLVYSQPGGQELTLDLYHPGGGPLPGVLLVHGGSWKGGDSGELARLNPRLAAAGYAVASINYRLAPEHRFPAALEDVQAAVAFVRERASELGIDPGRLSLLGRSAGGHLALLAAYGGLDVRGVIDLYGPTDLAWSWRHPSRLRGWDSRANIHGFLGAALEEDPEIFQRASPLERVRPGLPPTLILHGGRDELVSPTHSRRLAERLAQAGVPHLLVEIPAATHGLDANPAGPGGQIAAWSILRFLEAVNAR